jgi:hypothetical protein
MSLQEAPPAFENWSRDAGAREAAAAKPWDAVGRPVRWHLLHPARGYWSCSTGQSVAMNSVAVVATVVDVKAGKVVLSYQGRG